MSKFRDSTAGAIIILAVICLIVTAALAGTYGVAKPIIDEAEATAVSNALKVVLPEADAFTPQDSASLPQGLTAGYTADNGAGQVFLAKTKGYGGDVSFIIGLDSDGNYTGIEMTSHTETPGIGTKVGDPAYLSQYVGQENPKGVDVISGATITSKALQSALTLVTEASGGGPGPRTGYNISVVSGVVGYTELDIPDKAPEITHVFSSNNNVGYAFIIVTEGYGGDVTYHVGLDNDGKYTGVQAVEHSESTGIGDFIDDDVFLAQYVGETDAKGVDTKAGATVTHTSLKKALRLAAETLEAAKIAPPLAGGETASAGEGAGGDVPAFTVLPDADDFEEMNVSNKPDEMVGAYKATNGSGVAFVMKTEGYGGDVTYHIGMDINGQYTGINAVEHEESVGIGDFIDDQAFLDQYIGETDAKGVDTKAGATVTHTSLKKALRLAAETFATLDLAGGGGEAPGADNPLVADTMSIIPAASTLTELDVTEKPEEVKTVLKANDDLGYVFVVVTEGYGGDVTYHVGIGPDGTYTGVHAARHKETPGIGDFVDDQAFLDQYIGETDAKGVDTKAGATVTHTSLKKALRLASETLAAAQAAPELEGGQTVASA